MFVRIVKLSFHEENIPAFLENFELMKDKIRNAPVIVFWNYIRTKTTKAFSLLIVIGKPKRIWKTIEIQSFSIPFGHLPNNYSMQNQKLGV